MSRNILWVGLALVLVAGAFVSVSVDARSKKKKKGREHVSGPPSVSLAAEPYRVRLCEDALVRLNASATSPEGLPLIYTWSKNGGQIKGEGPNTRWDLSGVQPGVYQASVEVASAGYRECLAFSQVTVVVVDCPPPPKPRPVCPSVSVSCPDSITENAPVTFTATTSGGEGAMNPNYHWSVSAGRITSGQGTSSITVDTTGLGGQTIRADLDVGGYGMPCPVSCAVSIPHVRKSRKFDEYYDIARNDEKARLDNYVIELQNEPDDKGYIIVYPSRHAKRGEAEARAGRISDYLINTRGLSANRFEIKMGPEQDGWLFELFVVPAGATPPTPSR